MTCEEGPPPHTWPGLPRCGGAQGDEHGEEGDNGQ